MIRSQSQEENQVDFEYQWLTKFGRTSARKNLDSLKEKVNNIIKTWKDSGTSLGDDSAEGSKETARAFKEVLDGLQAPELKIKIPGVQVTAFVYNPQTRSLALGFKSGEIAFASLFRNEQLSSRHEKKHKFFKVEEENIQIEDMFLVSGKVLAVSKKRIFMIEEQNVNKSVFKNKLFDLEDNENRTLDLEGYQIKDVKYSAQFDSFYMLCVSDADKHVCEDSVRRRRLVVCFQVFKEDVKIVCSRDVASQVHELEPDWKNQNLIYVVTSKEVRKVTLLEDNNGDVPKPRQRNSIFQSQPMVLFNGIPEYKDKRDIFFSQQKTEIKSFKFDPKMEYFFINDEKAIKKYETKTKNVVYVFEGHANKINSFSFSDDYKLMFSLDDDRVIKIWDLKSYELKSTLNKKSKAKKIKDITTIDGGLQLATRNNEGIVLWRLRRGYRPFEVKEQDPDLSYSSLVLASDGRHMFFNFEDKKLFKIDLENNMQTVWEINLPWDEDDEDLERMTTFTPNGELVIFWEVPRGSVHVDHSDYSIDDDEDEEEDEDDEERIFRLDLILPEKLAEWAQEHDGRIDWDEDMEVPGVINLHKFKNEDLTVLNVITSQNQDTQVLDINKSKLVNSMLQTGMKRLDDDEILVYYGTHSGNCFMSRVKLSDLSTLYKIQIFSKGHPGGVMHQDEYKQTEMLDNSRNMSRSFLEITETFSKKPPPRIINDCTLFVKEYCEIVLQTQLRASEDSGGGCQYLHIFARGGSNIDMDVGWKSIRYNLGSASKDIAEEDLFKVRSMGQKYPGKPHRFFAAGGMGILLFTFDFGIGMTGLKLKKFFPKRIQPDVGVVHCPQSCSFFIPFKNQIQVWRDNLKTKTYTIDCDSPVTKLYLDTRLQAKSGNNLAPLADVLLVYEEENYREISTESMLNKRSHKILPGGDIVLNLDAFEPGSVFTFPRLQETVKRLTLIMDADSLDLASFPFESLAACFGKEDFRYPIIRLATYFFKQIKARSNENWCYGPMNPLLFSIYHNDLSLLEDLLEKYGYPRITAGYLSPLSFAFKLGYQSAVKVLCDYLAKRTKTVTFSRADFRYLLESSFGYCHRLLATIPSKPTLVNYRKFLSFDSNIALFFVENMGQLPARIDNFEAHDGKVNIKKLKKSKKQRKSLRKGKSKALMSQNPLMKLKTNKPKGFDPFSLLQLVKKKTQTRNNRYLGALQGISGIKENSDENLNDNNTRHRKSIRLEYGQGLIGNEELMESRDHHSAYDEDPKSSNIRQLGSRGSNFKPSSKLKINQQNTSSNLFKSFKFGSNMNQQKGNEISQSQMDPKLKSYLKDRIKGKKTLFVKTLIEGKNFRKENEKRKRKIQEIEAVQVPFKFSYLMGTPDSVGFLDSYANCKTEDFVISDWQEVIIYKWNKYKPFHAAIALLYWTFTLLATISIVFSPKNKGLKYISLFLLFVFWIYEVIELISYMFFKIGRYFEDPWNTIDWFNFLSLLIYFSGYHDQPEKSANKVLSTLSLIILFYRSFSYLRIISYFTTLVGMINVIISKLTIFFLILIYFYFGATLLIINLDPTTQHLHNLTLTYVLTIFGGIDTDQFFQYKYAGIALVFGTIVVTVILMNILIAFLSNLFSRLEEQQHVNALKEKASMILDLEVVVRFFRYYMTGAAQALKKHQLDSENLLFNLGKIPYKSGTSNKPICLVPKVAALLKKRRLLYIFRSVDFAESLTEVDIDENIYKKIKVLGKTVDTMQKHKISSDKIFLSALRHIDSKLDALASSKTMD